MLAAVPAGNFGRDFRQDAALATQVAASFPKDKDRSARSTLASVQIHRSEVHDALERLSENVRRSLASLDDHPADPAYESSALHLAVWTHAELIRIHPFEDGNGRSGRAIMTWILVRLGLRPIAFEVPKDEYLLCLNVYYTNGDLTPLIDLPLGCYRD